MKASSSRIILLGLVLFAILAGVLYYSIHTKKEAYPLSSGAVKESGVNIYIAKTGNDQTGNGSKTKPYATLQQAQKKIRAYKGKLPQAGVTVWVKQGNYLMDSSFQLDKKDSGTAASPITYRTYTGEQVTLSTGKTVTDWQPLSQEAQARVHPKIDPKQLVELDVRKLGMKHINGFAGGTSFTEQWGILNLFANNQMQPISRWPNTTEVAGGQRAGWAIAQSVYNAQSFYYQKPGSSGGNILDEDGTNRAKRWQNAIQNGHAIYLQGFWRTLWSPASIQISQIDAAQKTIKLLDTPQGGMGSKFSAMVAPSALARTTNEQNDKSSTPSNYRVGDGSEEFRALNLLEEIDTPGEWALDFKDGKIYYYPPSDIHQLQTVIGDQDTPIVTMDGTSYVQFKGFTLQNNMGNGFEMKRSHHITIAGNNIRNVNGGILDVDGHHNMFRSNNIYDTASFGISLNSAGDRATLSSANTRITNNHIHHIGKLIHLEAIIIRDSVGVRVDHNLLHDVPKDAVRYVFSNKLLLEYNEVHNTSLIEGDTGAFYTAQDWSSYGNVLRYNFIHHNKRSNGFYADSGSSGNTYQYNIIQDTSRAFLFENGHHNLAMNNLLIDVQSLEINDRSSQLNYRLDSDNANRLRALQPFTGTWKKYGQQLAEKYGLKGNLWSSVLSDTWNPQYPNGSKLNHNVIVGTGGQVKLPKNGDVAAVGNTTISSTSNAGFYNLATLDLRTKNAKILEKFPDLNTIFPTIGLYKDEYRTKAFNRADSDGLSNHQSTS